MAEQYVQIPSSSRSTSVDTTNWVSAVIMCFVVILMLSCKLSRSRRFQLDDFFILAAMAVSLGESVAVSKEVSTGLGRHEASLTLAQAQSYQKPYYAAQILYVAAVCITKLAVATILVKMRMLPKWVIPAGILIGLSVSWAFAVMSALSVRCVGNKMDINTPMSCVDEMTIWKASGIVDVVTDVLLVILAVFIVSTAQVSLKTRLSIMSSFGAKLICMPLIVLRIVFLDKATGSSDSTYDGADAAIVSQLAMNVGIVTTCLPYLMSFCSRMDRGTFTYDYRLRTNRRKSHSHRAEIDKATSLEAAFKEASQTSHARQSPAKVIKTPTSRSPQQHTMFSSPTASPRRRGLGLENTTPPRLQKVPDIRSKPISLPLERDPTRCDAILMPGPEALRPVVSARDLRSSSSRISQDKQLPAILAISPSVSDRERPQSIRSPPPALTRTSGTNRRRSCDQRGERRLSRMLSQVSSDTIVVATSPRHAPMSLTNTLAVLEQMQASDSRGSRPPSTVTRTQIMPAARRKPSQVTITRRRKSKDGKGLQTTRGHRHHLTPVLEISPSGSSVEGDKPAPLRISPAKMRDTDGRTFLDASSNKSQHNGHHGSDHNISRSGSRKVSPVSSHEDGSPFKSSHQVSPESSREVTPLGGQQRASSSALPPFRVSPSNSQPQNSSSSTSQRQVTPPSRGERCDQSLPRTRRNSQSPAKRPQTVTSTSETRLHTAASASTVATAPEYQPLDPSTSQPYHLSSDGLAHSPASHSPASNRTPEEEALMEDHRHLQVPTLTLNRSHVSYQQQQEQNDRAQHHSRSSAALPSHDRSASRESSRSQRFYEQQPPDHSPSSTYPETLQPSHTRDVSSMSADSDRPVTALPQIPPIPTNQPPPTEDGQLPGQQPLPPLPPLYTNTIGTPTAPWSAATVGRSRSQSASQTHTHNNSSSTSNPTGTGTGSRSGALPSITSPHLHPSPKSNPKSKDKTKPKPKRRRPNPLHIPRSNGSSSANIHDPEFPATLNTHTGVHATLRAGTENRISVLGERARTPRSPLDGARMVIRKLTTFGAYREEGQMRTGDGRGGVWRG